jgi:dihydroxyacetone kinase-like protein
MTIETMTGNIGKTEFAHMFAQAAACIRSEHRRLTELDSIGGDGDHGTTMLRAAEQMEGWPDASSNQGLADLLKAAGWRVLGVDGGASSGLLGTFFAGMGDIELGQHTMNCSQLAQSLQAGLRAVSRQTKARPGDKTMMDALIPAVDAVSAAAPVRRSRRPWTMPPWQQSQARSRPGTWLPVMAGPALWARERAAIRMRERQRSPSSSKDSGKD